MYYSKDMIRKERLKNIIIMSLIVALAIFSTYKIYYHFINNQEIDYNSPSLNIVFNEENGEKIDITKITPLNDSVGQSSSVGHNFTVTNTSDEIVTYKIKIVPNEELMKELDCEGIKINDSDLKVSVKSSNSQTKIYKISELDDNILVSVDAKPDEKVKYTIRVWVSNDSQLPIGSENHYHGLIQIIENDNTLAVIKKEE